jgi:hypothetical protein
VTPPQPPLLLDQLLSDLATASPTTTPQSVLSALRHRARALGRTDCLPAWLATHSAPRTSSAAAASSAPSPAADAVLHAKAASSNLPYALLRVVYRRALATSAASAAPATPFPTQDALAQARVNTFIRAASGDSTADTPDGDLLRVV